MGKLLLGLRYPAFDEGKKPQKSLDTRAGNPVCAGRWL
jgi:hypothetical protein